MRIRRTSREPSQSFSAGSAGARASGAIDRFDLLCDMSMAKGRSRDAKDPEARGGDSGDCLLGRAIRAAGEDESAVCFGANHRESGPCAAGRSRDAGARVRGLPFGSNGVAVVRERGACFVARHPPRGSGAEAHQFFHLGAPGKRTGGFHRPIESNVPRGAEGRHAADFVHLDPLERQTFRGRCESDMPMVGGRTTTIGRSHSGKMRIGDSMTTDASRALAFRWTLNIPAQRVLNFKH